MYRKGNQKYACRIKSTRVGKDALSTCRSGKHKYVFHQCRECPRTCATQAKQKHMLQTRSDYHRYRIAGCCPTPALQQLNNWVESMIYVCKTGRLGLRANRTTNCPPQDSTQQQQQHCLIIVSSSLIRTVGRSVCGWG